MSNPDNPRLGTGVDNTPPRNPQGYVQLVRDYFGLPPDEEVIEKGINETQRFNEGIPGMYQRYFITERIYEAPIPEPEEILAKWDPDGSKRSLRDKLEHIQADSVRLNELMDTVDRSIRTTASRNEVARMKQHFLLDQPNTGVDGFRPTEHYFWWDLLEPYRRDFEYPIRRILEEPVLASNPRG